MYCIHCGKKLKVGNIFCVECGMEVFKKGTEEAVRGQSETSPLNSDALPRRTKLLALPPICIILAVTFCSVFIITVVVMMSRDQRTVEVADISQTAKVELIEETFEIKEESAVAETTEQTESTQGISEKTQTVSESTIMVTVPLNSMSLRSTPGLGTDVICELGTGVKLTWNGESQTVGERGFYKVKVYDTGEEGYVSADFCTPAEFEYQFDELEIVDTLDSLYTYDAMCTDISELCDRYPGMLKAEIMGQSVDGRDIYQLVLGNPSAPNQIMMQAGIHGREYISTQLVMKMTEYYAHYYSEGSFKGTAYMDLFENTAIRLVPMSNPDSVTISQFGTSKLNNQQIAEVLWNCYMTDKDYLIYKANSNGDMEWIDTYKMEGFDRAASGFTQEITYDEYLRQWKSNANGVDINRNFNAGWESMELKAIPSYNNFKGYQYDSEPETQLLTTLADAREYKYFISYHARGQLIYCDTEGNTPETSASSIRLAELMRTYNRYSVINTTTADNVELGGFSDWIQLKKGQPSVTVELGKKPCPVGAEEFPSMFARNRETWALLAYESMNQ